MHVKHIYRSLLLHSLIIYLYFIFTRLTWNQVGIIFGIDWITQLLLQRGIHIIIIVTMYVWAISLLPWISYRGAKILSQNAQVSNTTGICFTILLYSVLAYHSFTLIRTVSAPFTTLSLFLSFFQD